MPFDVAKPLAVSLLRQPDRGGASFRRAREWPGRAGWRSWYFFLRADRRRPGGNISEMFVPGPLDGRGLLIGPGGGWPGKAGKLDDGPVDALHGG